MYDMVTRAKQVAMPIDQFSAYAAAAGDAEVGIDSFSTALRKLDQSLAAAKQGSAQSVAAFKSLGIDPTKIQTTQQGFKALADAFSKYRDDASKVAIAQQLLGRGGTEMIAFLNQGSAAIDSAAKHMHDLGVAFDADGARKLSAYDDVMDEFQGTIKGLSNTLALALLPTITDVTQRVTEFIQAWKDDGGLKKFIDGLGTLMSHLDDIAVFFATRFVATKIIAGFVAIGDAAKIAGTAVGVLSVAVRSVGGIVGLAATAIAGLVTVGRQWDAAQISGRDATDALRKSIEQLNGATAEETKSALQNTVAKEQNAQAALKAAQANLAELQSRAQLAKQQADKTLDLNNPGSAFAQQAGLGVATRNAAQAAQAKVKAQLDAITDLKKTIFDAQAAIGKAIFTPSPTANASKPSIHLVDPDAAAKADKLAAAYEALTKASYDYSQSLAANDPQQRAIKTMVDGVLNLTKLRDAYIKAGGSAAKAQEAFDQGFAGLKDKLTFDLAQPQRELDNYTASLRGQLDALKASNDVRIKSLTLGDHEAQNMQELAAANQEAAKAVTDFVLAHQLHPDAMSDDMYQKELAALKAYFAERSKLIQ